MNALEMTQDKLERLQALVKTPSVSHDAEGLSHAGVIFHPSVRPFSNPLILKSIAGVLEPIAAVFGQYVGYTCTGCQLIAGHI